MAVGRPLRLKAATVVVQADLGWRCRFQPGSLNIGGTWPLAHYPWSLKMT
jgi:hypothetical protein